MRAPGSWPGQKSIPSNGERLVWIAQGVRVPGQVGRSGARRGMIAVSVQVHPGASRDVVRLLADGSLDVRLRARPIEGQANASLIELLADRLGLRRRAVVIASGLR